PVMVEQRLADRLGGGADIDEKRGVVGDQPRRRQPDRLLLVGGDLEARLILHVLDAGREMRAAVDARKQALVAQVVEILADRLRRDGEMPGKVLDQDRAVVLGHLDNLIVPLRQEHDRSPTFVFSTDTPKRKQIKADSRLNEFYR